MIKLVQWMNRSKKVAWCYLGSGLAVLVLGIYFGKSTLEFVQGASKTQGMVSDLKIKDGKYYPVISYQDSEGESYQLNSRFACKPACFKKGEKVQVLYIYGQEARIDSFAYLWGPATLSIVVGIGFICGSLFQLNKQSVH